MAVIRVTTARAKNYAYQVTKALARTIERYKTRTILQLEAKADLGILLAMNEEVMFTHANEVTKNNDR